MIHFQTIYDFEPYEGVINDGPTLVTPNAALSPKEILRRFVRDMPVPATSKPLEIANDNLDNEAFPMQSGEFDPMEERDKLMQNENTDFNQ